MTQGTKDLLLALAGSLVGGFVGHHVGKRTHPALGTFVGVLTGAAAFPATVEIVRKATS